MFTLSVWVLLMFLAGMAIHFIPTFIAVSRDHPSKIAIFVVNFLLGWTMIGWLITLIWAMTGPAGTLARGHSV